MIDLLLALDVALSKAAVAFTTSHPALSRVMRVIVVTPEAKGAIPMAVFWYLWFKPSPLSEMKRVRLIAVLYVALAAITVGRLLSMALPFRRRPLASFEVMGVDIATSGNLIDWSAMPSDHAVVFVALATGMLYVSRTAGCALLFHALCVVCLSRVLTGLHFPSDIIIGSVIGCVTAIGLFTVLNIWLSKTTGLVPKVHRRISRPEIGYPLLFILTFEIATMFDGTRAIGTMLVLLLRAA